MPMSGAERQARHRARRLGVDGDAARLDMLIPGSAAARLARIARRYRVTKAEALSRLTQAAESQILDDLSPSEQTEYLRPIE